MQPPASVVDSFMLDLPTWIRAVVNIDVGAPALEFGGVWRPWRDLATAVDGLDALLGEHSLGEGTLVGVVIRNRPEMVRAIVAVLGTGRCLVTVSSAVPEASLVAEVRRLSLPVVIAGRSDWTDALRSAVADVGSLGVLFDDSDACPEIVVPKGTRPAGAVSTRPGVAVQMLTSGTTGAPKRIDLRYSSIEQELVSTTHSSTSRALVVPRLASGVAIVWNPLLHIGGLRGLITNIVAGRRIAMLERFNVPAWAALIAEHRPKSISLVPSALRMVLDSGLPREALAGVRAVISGTAPLSVEAALEFEERFGVPVLVVYGATEFAGGVAGWTLDDWKQFGSAKRGSVGRTNQGIEARVVDQVTHDVADVGASGLLEIRGAQLGRDGWMRTTDLARIDADGFIWIDGRADDVIIRGGFKVSTDAVAQVLQRHPAVLDACVVGIDDERLGQVPVAAVELREGADATADELTAWCKDLLTGYQVPVAIRVVDALPRTPSMKVSQPQLRSLFLAASG